MAKRSTNARPSIKKPAAGPMWIDPELGRFTYDDPWWLRTVDVPAFAAFNLHERRRPNPKVQCELRLSSWDGPQPPPAKKVELAKRVLANQAELAQKVIKALWDDFRGRGPASGMWWHGDLEAVTQGFEEVGLPVPTDADGLPPLMKLFAIDVEDGVDGYRKPVVELCFRAAFEEEHGVSVLTDGRRILGTGYNADVTPFKRKRRPNRKPTRRG